MSELQWALLILGAVAVVAIYFYSRRDAELKDWHPSGASDSPLKPKPPTKEQMDMFKATGNFDEFGVSRPRPAGRREPLISPAPTEPQSEMFEAPQSKPAVKGDRKKAPTLNKPEEKFIALLIAEREGTAILGPKLHDALRAQRLEFGAKQIYHRLDQGMVQFSVAGLLKPGTLDPAEALSFQTPGLSVFMLLPGPVKPLSAFDDMLLAAKGLARSLNAEVFDAKRQPLSAESAAALRTEVENWSRSSHLS